MKGLVFLGDRKLAFRDVPDPTPGLGEVVIEIKASGICGSDLHPYRAPHDPAVALESRMIRGHEPCGFIAAVGAGVPAHVAKPGDRVMVHHYFGCSVCEQCRAGWPQLCSPRYRRVHSVHEHGAHAPWMKTPASTLVPLHDALSFEAGAAIACGTGTAWGALDRLQPGGAETIAVWGQGPVGLSLTLLAAARGMRVIAIDIDEHRLQLARSFGADAVLNGARVDVPAAIRDLTAGRGAPLAVESSGNTKAATEALASLATWGRLCCVGLGSQLALDMRANLDRQLTVLTSYSMSTLGQMACAEFIVERKLGPSLDRLFTDRWPLDQAAQAYALFDRQTTGKAVFVF